MAGDDVMKRIVLRDARRATVSAKRARERRDEAIRIAARRASYREIAEAVGLSKPRVAKIVTET